MINNEYNNKNYEFYSCAFSNLFIFVISPFSLSVEIFSEFLLKKRNYIMKAIDVPKSIGQLYHA